MDEIAFIKYLAKKFKKGPGVITGIGDDAAVIKYKRDKCLLISSDMLVENVHFRLSEAMPQQIGYKAIACNISDIAAMGGIPKFAICSVGAPKGLGINFLKKISEGIDKITRDYNIKVIGGDTNRSGLVVIDVVLLGEVEKSRLVLRRGAKAGDLIFVTGQLGKGRLTHMDFKPRLYESKILVGNFKINSMIDISDGLAIDLSRIAGASRVGACIYKNAIPVSEKAKSFDEALSGGEDFELLFTLSVKEARKMLRYMGKGNYLDITLIGEIRPKKEGLMLVDENGRLKRLKPVGFEHF